jgi:hypothetical protein
VSYVPFKGGAELEAGLEGVRNAKADAVIVFPEGATMVARTRSRSSPSPSACPRCSAGASTRMRADS